MRPSEFLELEQANRASSFLVNLDAIQSVEIPKDGSEFAVVTLACGDARPITHESYLHLIDMIGLEPEFVDAQSGPAKWPTAAEKEVLAEVCDALCLEDNKAIRPRHSAAGWVEIRVEHLKTLLAAMRIVMPSALLEKLKGN